MTITARLAIATLLASAAPAAAGVSGHVGLYATHFSPNGKVDNFTEGAWGGGLEMVTVLPGTHKLLGVAFGLEAATFDSKKIVLQPTEFDFRRELTTSQDLFRLYLGLQLGPHGHGFFQPYVAVHGTVINHSVNTTLTEPDDLNPENTRTQEHGEGDWGVGYDATLGANFNFWDRVGVNGGIRYLHSFGLEEPLGDEDKKIDPEYFLFFFGASMTFDVIDRLSG